MKKQLMESQLFDVDGRVICCSIDFFFKIKRQLNNDEFIDFVSHQKFENNLINEYIDNYKAGVDIYKVGDEWNLKIVRNPAWLKELPDTKVIFIDKDLL